MNDHDPGPRPRPEPVAGDMADSPDAPEPEAAEAAGKAEAPEAPETAEAPELPEAPGTAAARDAPLALADEEALRRLLRDIVDDIEPSAESLEHLRTAVPARMRRRKQVLVGAATSAVVLAVGLTMVVSAVAGVGGAAGDPSLDAGSGHSTTGLPGSGDGDGALGRHPSDGPVSGATGGPGTGAEEGEHSGDGDDAGAAEAAPESWETMGVTSPTCDRGQLGRVETVMDPPDAQGRVYGLIRMANVSDQPCRVTGNGEMAALPLDDVPSAEVEIVDRTEGDRATRLPPPDQAHEELILPPGQAYEVRFAFVPDEAEIGSCEVEAEPAPGPGEEPPPDTSTDGASGMSVQGWTAESADGGEPGVTAADDSGSGGDTPTGTDGESDGTTGGGGDAGDPTGEPTGDPTGGSGDPGGEPDDVVLLRYTPAAGEPEAAEIRLEGDCSGTVYRTGVLEVPAG
ncbi:hypothetical protein [Streptomyces sp. URMC 129]|uniref:hypothetical protein n=1 Tax=Streptomyces sp. URMC 129 TaxID=3423407 RepID=UPI003F1C825A